ncbi:MAG: TonB-dependent receptor [Saprospiraceae bacterium]
MKFHFLLLFLFLSLQIGLSQYSKEIADQLLDSVVYTVNRSEQDLSEVGRNITIITHDQIKNSNAHSFGELISTQAGIYVIGSSQNPGQIQSIFSRSANSNQTNILIDGVKISNASSTDNIVDLSEISLSNIERIEIIRGNHSSLFGSSSIGATINIVSKSYDQKGCHGEASIRIGTFGNNTSLLEPIANLSYNFSQTLGIQLGVDHELTKGINATIDTIRNSNNYKFKNTDRDNFNKNDLWAKAFYKKSNWNIICSYRNHYQKSDLDKGAFRDDDNYTSTSKRNHFSINGNFRLNSRIEFNLISGYSQLNYRYVDDSSQINKDGKTDQTYVDGSFRSRSLSNEVQIKYSRSNLKFLAGLSHQSDAMGFRTYYFSNEFGPFEYVVDLYNLKLNTQTLSEFGQLRLNGSIVHHALNKFDLSLSLRNSHNDQFGNYISYEVNPSFKLDTGLLLFASFATGLTTPSLYQLYSPDRDFTSGITRGNPFLKAESSNSFEIGIKHKLGIFLSYSFSYFINHTNNNIDYIYLWNSEVEIPKLSYLDYRGDTYINLGKRITHGIEAEVSSRLNKYISLNLNISLTKGKTNYNNSGIDTNHIHSNSIQLYNNGAFVNVEQSSQNLIRRPSTANFGIHFNFVKPLTISLVVKYVDSRNDIFYDESLSPFGALNSKRLSDYKIFDLKFLYRISKFLNTGLRLENLFDTQYSEINGYACRGRGAYLNFNINF